MEKTKSNEFAKLIDNFNGSVSEIQKHFEDYQKANFPERSPQFFCLELNGEAGELANKEKKIWKGRELDEAKLADEAADVFIALMNYVNSRNLNLEASIIHKLEKIEKIRLERESEGLPY
jgi:NTP pyrophosphatase (non-canonical NTP hydrolase)